MIDLKLLRLVERNVQLARDALGDGVACNGDAAEENPSGFKKNQVRGTGPDIDEELATRGTLDVVAGRIIQRHGGHVDEVWRQPSLLNRIGQRLDNLPLDGRQHDVQFLVTGPNKLVVPDHLLNGKRDVLLRLVGHDLIHLFTVHRRQLDEPGENRLPRDT